MVFSSIPAYLDPSNWHQQQQAHQIIGSSSGGGGSAANPLLPPPPQPPGPPLLPLPPHAQQHGGSGAGSVRPGSMSERARMANIPMPETALKCPRCESANTKFCYFNNYSLSQPRHFCKTCRRYWTRGGALRNVPVGGGCRRNNKRSKSSSSSKSSPASSERQTTNNPASTSGISTSSAAANSTLPQLPPLRFMSPLGQLSTDSFAGDMGLNYSGMTAGPPMEFHSGITSNLMGPGGGHEGGGGGVEQWRMQQLQHSFPFFGGLDLSSSSTPGVYQFYGGSGGETGFTGGVDQASNNQIRAKGSSSVKMEENPHHHHHHQLLRGLMAGNDHHDQQWNSNNTAPPPSWTDLSSNFSSSSTSNPV